MKKYLFPVAYRVGVACCRIGKALVPWSKFAAKAMLAIATVIYRVCLWLALPEPKAKTEPWLRCTACGKFSRVG